MPRNQNRVQQRRRGGRRSLRGRGRLSGRVTSVASATLTFMRVMRVFVATLPIDKSLISLFDAAFNWILKVVAQKSYYAGAYCMFKITPGALMSMSPLLARNGANFSFPGHPVSVKYLGMTIVNTTKMSERPGRWAAVFIPYRELHDDRQIPETLKDFTFQEVCSMPHAVSGPAGTPLRIHYKMRDKTMYCARPRELSEAIGIVAVFWDVSRDESLMSAVIPSSSFCCEINLYAGCLPHVIFGPTHRVNYSASVFELKTITNGMANIHFEDGHHMIVQPEEVENAVSTYCQRMDLQDIDEEFEDVGRPDLGQH